MLFVSEGAVAYPKRCKSRGCRRETFEKCSVLSKIKEDENFNRNNTFSISRSKI
jgi:hypothetical protein